MAVLYPQSNTLNQLNAMLKEIANDLAVFNSYHEGELSEINAVTNKYYPLLWNEINPVSIHETYTTYNFRLYAMDLVKPDLKNRLEVQSDMLHSLHHVLYTIRDAYRMVIGWDSLSATPFIQQFNDMVGGWYIDVKIDIPWSEGSCSVPLKSPYSPFVNNVWINDKGDYFMADDQDYYDFGDAQNIWTTDDNDDVFIDDNNNQIIVN